MRTQVRGGYHIYSRKQTPTGIEQKCLTKNYFDAEMYDVAGNGWNEFD